MKHPTYIYFFPRCEANGNYSDIDSHNQVELRWFIGEELSKMIRQADSAIELMRIAHRPNGYEFLVYKRINDIKLIIHDNRTNLRSN